MLLLGKQLYCIDLSSMTCIKSAAPRAGSIIGTRHVSLGHGAACAVIIAALILPRHCIIAGYRHAVRSWVTPQVGGITTSLAHETRAPCVCRLQQL